MPGFAHSGLDYPRNYIQPPGFRQGGRPRPDPAPRRSQSPPGTPWGADAEPERLPASGSTGEPLMALTTVLVAKECAIGRVKTRLAATVGDQQAARCYQLMLETFVERLLSWAVGPCILAITPDEAATAAARRWPGFADVWTQGSGDLGDRLKRLTARAWQTFGEPTLFLGVDAPDLPVTLVRAAGGALQSGADAVISPSADGGYCLVGVARPLPALFHGIDWGTSEVADQTRRAAEDAGLRLDEVDGWEDVDDFEDLQRLLRRLAGSRDASLRKLHDALLSAKLSRADERYGR